MVRVIVIYIVMVSGGRTNGQLIRLMGGWTSTKLPGPTSAVPTSPQSSCFASVSTVDSLMVSQLFVWLCQKAQLLVFDSSGAV